MIDLSTLQPVYLATPYTKYNRGLSGAYIDACKLAARFYWRYGFIPFSPVAHSHGLTTHGDLPSIDRQFWHSRNLELIRSCGFKSLVIAKMDGWDESFGVTDERNSFSAAGKPIYYLDVESLELSE